MTTEQKLREAFEARMTDNGKWPRAVEQGRNGCYLLAQTENAWVEWQACAEALATTEPEPTGMPELPEPDLLIDADLDSDAPYQACSVDLMRDYGEQCWKAGYKHGAWGDRPAVNQQLTTEPVDEREAFEHEMSCEEIWGHRSFKKKQDGRYANWCVDLMWDVWQARAAMTQVGDINVVESFTNDTKDAERYRWLASSESVAMNAKSKDHQWAISDAWTTLEKLDADKALIDAAIDAAMAKGVK